MSELEDLIQAHHGGEEETPEQIEAKKIEEEERLAKEEEERLEAEEAAKKEEEDKKDTPEEIILGGDDNEEDKKKPDGSDTNDVTIDDEAFFKFASEKLGRDVKSLEDLTIREEVKLEESEQLTTLRKFQTETGRDLRDWFEMESINVEGMTDEQLVKADMALEFKGKLTESQINKKFNSKYKLDSERFDEDEVEVAQIDLKVDAERAKEGLAKIKEGYKIPVLTPKKEDPSIASKQFQEDKEAYVKSMSNKVDEIEYFSFDVDGQTIKYKLDAEDVKGIKDANSNLENHWNRFMNDKGVMDINELSVANYFSKKENVAKLIKLAVKGRYMKEGEDTQIRKQKNTKLPDVDKSLTTESQNQAEIKQKFADTIQSEISGGKKASRFKF